MIPLISYLAQIHFGPEASAELPRLIRELGMKRPLVVTDPGVIAAGLIARAGLSQALSFAEIGSNPSEQEVLAGLQSYRAQACDGLVAVGGGSAMDCAKAIALLVHHPLPLGQYAFLRGGLGRIAAKMPPLIAVPTTAGTGSEVGRAALITLTDGGKTAFLSPRLIPQTVVCDPVLTVGAPPGLSAGAGMDAISHCLETYCSPRFNPVAEAIALDGLARACGHLLRVVQEGNDLAPRSEMMMAALQGGLCFQKGLGLIHSLSHPLGAVPGKRLHHGTLNGVFLPHVLRHNYGACPVKMERITQVLGLGHARELPEYFEELARQCGLPARLRDLGLSPDDLAPLVPLAQKDHCSATNPSPVTEKICEELYAAAY